MTQQSFEKFYYKNVATGEGCGCAERIIDVHEFQRLAGRPRRVRSGPSLLAKVWRSLCRAVGAKPKS